MNPIILSVHHQRVRNAPTCTPLEVSSFSIVGGAASRVDQQLRALRVGGNMWTNTTTLRPGLSTMQVLLRWPVGLGLEDEAERNFMTVREPPPATAGAQRRGRVILLNMYVMRGRMCACVCLCVCLRGCLSALMIQYVIGNGIVCACARVNRYPPSRDGGNSSGAQTTLWDPATTDMASVMGTAVLLAAQTEPVASPQGEDADDVQITDVIEAIRDVINSKGVPRWNSGDYAGCARAYHRVAARFAATEPRLAQALVACAGQPLDSSQNSQGWILRRALDATLKARRAAADAGTAGTLAPGG